VHQLLSQLGMIVDLAIEHGADLAVLVPHRLVAGRQIDDREAPMAKEHTPQIVDMKAVAVGPAMRQSGGHALKVGAAAAARESGQPAHPIRPFCRN
jgi:hypothetical protein